MLQAADVRFGYGGTPVLRGVSADIRRGGLVGILGPNGSGKSTLLRLLSGALVPDAGSVLLDGEPVHRIARKTLARRMAIVPQETHLAFEYTVLEMVLMGRHPHLGLFQVEGPADIGIARDALAATCTEHLEARDFNTLSGGEKQRVVIAAALAQAADILLLDEPTASLDLGYQLEIAALLHALNRDRGITIVVSTHDLNLAASLCQELILLRDGQVLAAGPTEEVLTPDSVRALYDVEADVHTHDETGHVTVVPIARIRAGQR